MNAKIMEAIAVLQEQVQMKTVGKAELFDKVTVANFSYSEYPKDGFLKRVSYGAGDTYVFDLQYVDRLGDEIKKNLVGGEGVNGSLNLLRNVYGINEDFTVWYIDENGKMYGARKIVEIPIEPSEVVKASSGLKQGMGIEGDLTVGDVRGRQNVTIDGSKMTEPITDLEELTYFPNLTEITIKNLSLNNISGLQYSPNLKQIWFDNTTSLDYSGLKYCLNTTGLYLINGSVTEENMADITNQFPSMNVLNTVRIRNNNDLKKIPELETIGNISTLWIEENANLTNIYGLSTVKIKTSLTSLYLNENNLTDVVTTTDKNEEYDYLLPMITDENIINMSYIDGYSSLDKLICDGASGYNAYYENGETDINRRNQPNIKYLCGLDTSLKLVGVSSLVNISEIDFENCNLLDVNTLDVFKAINKIYLLNNNSITVKQVNHILALLNDAGKLTLNGDLIVLLGNNKKVLDYSNCNLTNLDFLNGNKIVEELYLSQNRNLVDVSALNDLTQLKTLVLRQCGSITDWSFLNNLSNLTYLDLHATLITDEILDSYRYPENLTHLEIAYCKKIDNFDFLRKYKNALKNYAFYNCGVSVGNDVSILNEVFSGKEFWLSGGDLTTVQSILNRLYDPFEEIVPNSSYVFCTGDQYINEYYLTQYEKCTELEKIVIKCRNNTNYFNGTNDTLNLKDLKVLKKLYLDGVSIENIDVQGATNLEKVAIIDNLRGNYWKPCDFSKNNKLIYLDLSKNKLENSDLENLVNNIKPEYSGGDLVSGCPLLEELHLNNNNFSTIASIENLTIVKKLDVSNNMLINLNGIENLTQLTELNISNNPGITNITPILTLKNKDGNNLSKVTLTGCNGISLEAKESLKQTGITVVEN